eukprot:TRINITY_DN16469_c0_g1_i1.p1 TRINITY_DN16469_c0_g1~~TRINITY_DN16469_c0_g1_i1.p1  ORF type:complete len:410 (+),score=51.37 TRINITY_DN16469_c0_g1_i1:87-1316(+)
MKKVRSSHNETDEGHRPFKALVFVVVILAFPLLVLSAQFIVQQETAVLKWQPTPITIINSTAVNSESKTRSKLKWRADWRVSILYKYQIQGVEYTSSRVWFYGDSTGNSMELANEIVNKYTPGSNAVAHVSTEDPAESMLLPQLWFRPYSYLLLCMLALQIIAWCAIVEYDWSARSHNTRKLQPHPSTSGRWFVIHSSGMLRPLSGFCTPALLLAFWHVTGIVVYSRYTALSYLNYGYVEQLSTYHIVGLLLIMRLLYLCLLSYYFSDTTLLVDANQLKENATHKMRLMQSVHHPSGSLFYNSVRISLFRYETQLLVRNRRTTSDRQLRYKTCFQLLQDAEVHSQLDHQFSPVVFNSPTSETHPKGNITHLVDWFLTVDVIVRHLPITYSVTVPVHVHPSSKIVSKKHT